MDLDQSNVIEFPMRVVAAPIASEWEIADLGDLVKQLSKSARALRHHRSIDQLYFLSRVARTIRNLAEDIGHKAFEEANARHDADYATYKKKLSEGRVR